MKFIENSIKISLPIKIPDNGTEFTFILLKFHLFLIIFTYSGVFHFIPVKRTTSTLTVSLHLVIVLISK